MTMSNQEVLETELCTALDRFVREMRAKLVKNSHKSGWSEMHPVAILARLCEEVEELLSSCTPVPRADRPNGDAAQARHLDTQRELMLVAMHHVRSAAQVLERLRTMPARAKVTSPRTAGEAADVANFCMFLSHQLLLPLSQGEPR